MPHKKEYIAFSITLVSLFVVFGGLLIPALRSQSPTLPAPITQEELPKTIQAPIETSLEPEPVLTQRPDVAPAPTPPADERAASSAPKQEEVAASIEQEFVYYPLRIANDPGYAGNWALQRMKAPAAWDITTGSASTTVAVIDSGFALNHDDLSSAWYVNSGEQGTTIFGDRCWTGTPVNKQTNNCDDDNNGYQDDWRGWNFVLTDNNPQAGRENPNGNGVFHGTEVAGLVGATGNNNTGITTLSWNTRIMPLQALSDDGPGFTSDVAAAIYYAVDNGADVINMSLGSNSFDPAIQIATNYAYANNVVVVAAAGNCGTGTEPGCSGYGAGFIGYPARNTHVISVGATTSSDARASFSSFGPALDVVAPGSGTINTPTWTQGNQTSLYSSAVFGTSYAAPYVSSLAALIKSIRPATSVDDMKALLMATTSKPTAMTGLFYTTQLGHGLIDAERAVTIATSLNASESVPVLLQAGGPRSEGSFAGATTLGSGCETVAPGTYCTVRMRDDRNLFERYLPYTVSSGTNQAGWTWATGMLSSAGDWSLRAIQGELTSPQYFLSGK